MTQTLPKTIHKEIKKFIALQESSKLLDSRKDYNHSILVGIVLKDITENLTKIAGKPTINDHHQAIKDYMAVFDRQWTTDEKTLFKDLKKAHDRLIEIAKTPYAKDR